MTQSTPPKQSHLLRNIFIGVLIAVFLCIGCLVVTGGAFLKVFQGVIDASTALGDTSNSFMTALKNSDYTTAYSLLDPSLQKELGGSADAMRDQFVSLGLDKPTEWKFTGFNINNNTGQVDGTVTLPNIGVKTLSLVLSNSDNKWKISGVNTK